MGLFSHYDRKHEIRTKEEEAISKLKDATLSLAKVEARLQATVAGHGLVKESTQLKREISDLEIKKAEIEAKHEREKKVVGEKAAREAREIEHKTALVLEGAERDRDNAKLEAELMVREENLTKAEERFEEHLKFVESRFKEHTDRLDSIVDKVLERLPDVNAALAIGEPRRETDEKTQGD